MLYVRARISPPNPREKPSLSVFQSSTCNHGNFFLPSAWNFFIPSSFGKLHTFFPSRFSPSRRRRPSMGSQGRTWGIGRGREGKRGGKWSLWLRPLHGWRKIRHGLERRRRDTFFAAVLGGEKREECEQSGSRSEAIVSGGYLGWGRRKRKRKGENKQIRSLSTGSPVHPR